MRSTGLPLLIHFGSAPEKLSDLCWYLCWHLESQEVGLSYEKRQEKTELFKSQNKCWSLSFLSGLTSK